MPKGTGKVVTKSQKNSVDYGWRKSAWHSNQTTSMPDYVYRNSPGYNADWLLKEHQNPSLSMTSLVEAPYFLGEASISCSTYPPPQVNYCFHTKYNPVCWPVARQYWNAYFSYTYFKYFERFAFPLRNGYQLLSEEYEARCKFDESFSARAYWSMRPKFEGQVSMINSLYELKDFRSLPRQLKNMGYALGRFTQWKTPRTKLLAEAWLMKSYAIDPTIADIAAIAAQCMTSAAEAQSNFISEGLAGNKLRYSEVSRSTGMYSGQTFTEECKLTASGLWKYQYTRKSTIDAFIHYWGLTGTAEAFWNMIPLSFLVDYFLSIGKSLAMMRVDKNVVNSSLEHYCESVRIKKSVGTHIVKDAYTPLLFINAKPVNDNRPHLLSGYEGVTYLRVPKEPYKGLVFPKLKKPSLKQTINMAALLRTVF